MHSAKVSVVMPTYNRAHLIGAAIQSALDQTFQDFELIVVDDGSTDATEAVVKGLDDPRIRYLYQENRGIGGARNNGIRQAEGQYIAFLDSDDVWLPEFLALGVEVLEANPGVGLVYAKAQAIDDNGNLMAQIRGALQKYQDDTLKSVLYGDFICIIACLVRRRCFDRVGLFDESLKAREDWDMWARMAKYYRFTHIDKVLAHFRTHELQRTGGKSEYFGIVCESGIAVLDKAYSDPDLPEGILAIKRLAYRNVYMEAALRWFGVRAWRQSARYSWKAILVSPSPLTTPFRIAWLILFYEVLSKSRWGSHIISRLVHMRRTPRTT